MMFRAFRAPACLRQKQTTLHRIFSGRATLPNTRKGSMANLSKTTRDHEEIRKWAEERGGKPAHVKATGSEDDIGILRIDFPGYSGQGSLEPITWEQFFEKFDERGLSLVYQEQTAAGARSNFNKLVSAKSAAESESRSRGSRSRAKKGSGKKPASKKAASTGASNRGAKKAAKGTSRRSSGKKAAAKKASSRRSGLKKAARNKTAAKNRSSSRRRSSR